MGRTAQCDKRIRWSLKKKQKNGLKNESVVTKMKDFTEKKVLYFKESITFQSKYYKFKKVLY